MGVLKMDLVRLVALVSLLHASGAVFGQIKPLEGAELNYRIVDFAFTATGSSAGSTIEIARGNYSNKDSFTRHIYRKLPVSKNHVVAELPYFGCAYTWRVNTGKAKNELHHFRTGTNKNIDTSLCRLRIIKPAVKYKDGYVFSDGNKAMYDMQGKPVWYLPDLGALSAEDAIVRNLRMSTYGTITLLANNRPYEIDFDGKILWEAPKNTTELAGVAETYHHEFKRLNSGNYMVMGSEDVLWEWRKTGPDDSNLFIASPTMQLTEGQKYVKMPSGTILEFDPGGKLVWRWRSSDHWRETNTDFRQQAKMTFGNHENSFYFDEKDKDLYISFKNTNQIVKVKYPEGMVTHVYGNEPVADSLVNDDDFMFSNQHSLKESKKGYIYIFSNNMNTISSRPSVVRLKEPTNSHERLKKIWEYVYPVQSNGPGENGLTNGGNVVELPDASIFVSMCSPFGNVFIVSNEKKLFWEGIFEKRNVQQNTWLPAPQYRASIISSRKKLEQIIYGQKSEQ